MKSQLPIGSLIISLILPALAPAQTLSSLTLSDSSVVVGAPLTGQVTIAGSRLNVAVVTLFSEDSNIIVPEIVTVPFGRPSAQFAISTRQVCVARSASITATLRNVTRSAPLVLSPLLITEVSLSPASVFGGAPAFATVKVDRPAPPGGWIFGISSSNPAVASVFPPHNAIPEGATEGTYRVDTFAVAACTSVDIEASCGQQAASATLLVGVNRRLTANDMLWESWSSRHPSTSRGMVLWTEGADPFNPEGLYLFNGAATVAVPPDGSAESVTTTVFGLGTGLAPGVTVAAWRKGTDFAWVWSSDSSAPVPIDTVKAHPFDPNNDNNRMNPEGLAIAGGCLFMVMQAFDPGTNRLSKHIFKVDVDIGDLTGLSLPLSGSGKVPGAPRVKTSGCQSAWVFDPDFDLDANGDPQDTGFRQLHFYDGAAASVVDSGLLSDTDYDFKAGRIVYQKRVNGISHVFLYDSTLANPVPVRISPDTAPGQGHFSPKTDGFHIAWLAGDEENGSFKNFHIVFLGGMQFTDGSTQPLDASTFKEFPFQLQGGQLLWRDKAGDWRYAHGNQIETLCIRPPETVIDPWLADGLIAWYGQPNDPNNGLDDEVFFYRGTTPVSPSPLPPPLVSATAGDRQVTVLWDLVLGATSFNLYMAKQSGLTKDNFQTLLGGTRFTGATTPFTASSLTNGDTYYFVVTAVKGGVEGSGSEEVQATPLPVWRPVSGLAGIEFHCVTADLADPQVAYAGGGGTVYKTTNAGAEWAPLPGDVNGRDVRALAASGQKVHAATRDGDLWRSLDGGSSWALAADGIDLGEPRKALAFDHGSSILYAADFKLPAMQEPQDSFVIISFNEGDSWDHQPDFPDGEIRAYAFALDHAGFMYAGGTGTPNLVKSGDHGAHWEEAALPGSNYVYSLASHPTAAETIYAGTRDHGVYKTVNGGDAWIQKKNGLPSPLPSVDALFIDPESGDRGFAGTESGVFLTVNGGDAWIARNQGLTTATVRTIHAFAIASSTSARQLIAATAAGLFLLELETPAPIGPVAFKRADSDGSGVVDITDAVHTLEFLFLGKGELACYDAADVNDDGNVDVTDAIASLIWLFIDPANPPAAPGPEACGLDTTPAAEPVPECRTTCS